MKKLKTTLAFFVGISLMSNLSGFAQKKSTKAPPLIKALPNGVTVRNFSIAIHDIERYENSANIKFVARKIGSSTQKFPFNYIRAVDDHDNRYQESSGFPIFSNVFEDLIIAAPLGLTWYFNAYIPDISQAAPIVKIELILGIMTVVKTIDLAKFPLRRFDPKQEINSVSLKNANIISSGTWSKKDKYVEWSVGKIKLLNTQGNINNISVEKFWLIPIIVRNSDYNGTSFSLAFFFQLNDGTIVPFRSLEAYYGESDMFGRFCDQGEANCINWSHEVGGEIGEKSISAQTTEYLNYYYLPVSINRNPQIPKRIFMMSFDKTWFMDVRANCKLSILEINSTVFDDSEPQ